MHFVTFVLEHRLAQFSLSFISHPRTPPPSPHCSSIALPIQKTTSPPP